MSEVTEKQHVKKKGEVIFCEHEPGQTVFIIREGRVKLTKVVEDNEKTLAILEKGDLFGEMSVLKNLPRSATAVAAADTTLLELGRESFFQLIQRAPKVGIQLLKTIAERLADQRRKLRTLSISTIDGRVIDALLIHLERGQAELLSETSVRIQIDEKSLAGWAGIKLEDCRQSLRQLESTQKIMIENPESIVIKNINLAKTLIS